MLRLLLIIIVFFIPFVKFSQNSKPIPGEKIDYSVSFGVFNAGKASIITDTITYNLDDNEVFKIIESYNIDNKFFLNFVENIENDIIVLSIFFIFKKFSY